MTGNHFGQAGVLDAVVALLQRQQEPSSRGRLLCRQILRQTNPSRQIEGKVVVVELGEIELAHPRDVDVRLSNSRGVTVFGWPSSWIPCRR